MSEIGFTGNEIRTKSALENACRIAAQIPLADVEDYVTRWDWFHSLGCMIDPTNYRDFVVTDLGKGHEKLARAFLAFRKELEAFNPANAPGEKDT